MDFIKNNVKQLSIVLVLALGIGAFALTSNKPKDKQDNTEAAKAASEKDTADSGNSLTAGVTSQLLNNSEVSVDSESKDIVGSRIGDSEDGTICGYKNLGIANITEGNLNIRKKAAADSEIAGKMTKHNACEILASKGEWYQVKSGKVKGYVKAEFILTGEEALEIAKKEVQTIATVTGTQTLRVREKESQDSKTLALVAEEEDLDVVVSKDKDDDFSKWVKVEVDDQKGYVSADYVSFSQKLPTAKTITEIKYGGGISDVRVSLVQYALQFVGNRYVWGGTSLTHGIDCSGFTMQVYAKYGIYLPHHAASQPGYGVKIKAAEAQPGDLFFYGGSSIGHVGIYIGNGQIVHASNKRDGIKISNAYYRTPICVVRYFN